MFDKEMYQETFSKVTASEETYWRVMDMAKERKVNKSRRFLARAVAIAAVISVLAVTASASEYIQSWFVSYFSNGGESSLSTEQVEYIENNEQKINEKQTQNGYTIELKSAITDGTIAYITLGVTAPENVVLTRTEIEGYDPQAPILSAGNWGVDLLTDADGDFSLGSRSMSTLEDNDGLDHTQNLVITVHPDWTGGDDYPFTNGMVWNIHLEDLIARYTNAEYMKEVQEKYSSEEDVSDVVDEALLWPEVTLAEGCWDFEITFSDSDFREIELISEPVSALAFVGSYGDVGSESFTNIYEEVPITSFILRSLSATVCSDREGAFAFSRYDHTKNEKHAVYAVMDDGSRVELMCGSDRSEVYMWAEAPIVLDNVAYVEFTDGTKLIMPE